jgi:EAL domain-containing protein (putative c-di-GMP-specific phosphodiesterase class I)
MAFQPIVSVEDGTISAHEALVRGPAGEGAATILDAVTAETRYAFDQACRVKAISLAAALGLTGRLSINFMPNAIYDPAACIRLTLATARKHGVPLDALTFEITEDERISDFGFMRAIITEYRRHGFRIALDDFGAGFSGLNTLLELQPDIVKFDRGMVSGIDRDLRKRTLTTGLLALCRDMGISITAEGVETEAELSVLIDAGVSHVQGYLLARPAFERLSRREELGWQPDARQLRRAAHCAGAELLIPLSQQEPS